MRRSILKAAEGLLRHAAFVRNMREDIAGKESLAKMDSAVREVRQARREKAMESLEAKLKKLDDIVREIMPPRSWPTLREYVEIGVVALSVAMACRTYFLQPFKIPTGSMQTTLYGIHYVPTERNAFREFLPVKCLNWFYSGEWYREVRAPRSGKVTIVAKPSSEPLQGPIVSNGVLRCDAIIAVGVAGPLVNHNMRVCVSTGQEVEKGGLIACGSKVAGDHLFVDMVSWNFRAPRLSEVMVFLTTGIHEGLQENMHYIKRMVGLPGNTLTLEPPYIAIDGKRVEDFTIGAIGRDELGNGGYRFAEADRWRWEPALWEKRPSIHLEKDTYLACGDNTRSSLDSRFWGPVPRKNLVGPGMFIYWPLNRMQLISR